MPYVYFSYLPYSRDIYLDICTTTSSLYTVMHRLSARALIFIFCTLCNVILCNSPLIFNKSGAYSRGRLIEALRYVFFADTVKSRK